MSRWKRLISAFSLNPRVGTILAEADIVINHIRHKTGLNLGRSLKSFVSQNTSLASATDCLSQSTVSINVPQNNRIHYFTKDSSNISSFLVYYDWDPDYDKLE